RTDNDQMSPGVWADGHRASIAPGESVMVTANGGSQGSTWTAVEGTHTVTAHVDDVNRISESDTGNNVLSATMTVAKPVPKVPDLVVTEISWLPEHPEAGDIVTMQATIKNQGTGPTPEGVIHGVLFRTDNDQMSPGVWSDSHRTSIAPGASVTVTANGGSQGSTWTAVRGSHTVTAHVDDVNRIAESDAGNNVLSSLMHVGQGIASPPEKA
ncbi:MAG: CARDB domain-containing protein, partial [Methanomicrobiaceae archaeon]|nr:CARDB domain-containing protein [Methanomicrobiaceae archaeon]